MEKDLKKCYQDLELPYNATIEQVEAREKALIKILSAKENNKKISYEREIGEVKISANKIVENIKKHGIPKEENHDFEASNESVAGILIVFVFVVIICFFSFYML